jgi:hypothetical protein
MESQDSSQETQPEVPEPENTSRPTRDLLAQLIPLHPTAEYLFLAHALTPTQHNINTTQNYAKTLTNEQLQIFPC